MIVSREKNKLILEFQIEETALEVQMLLVGLQLKSIGTMLPDSDSKPQVVHSGLVLTDQRLAEIESQRNQNKQLQANQAKAEKELRSGVLPFKESQKPPQIKVKDSPRLKAIREGKFAGEEHPKKT